MGKFKVKRYLKKISWCLIALGASYALLTIGLILSGKNQVAEDGAPTMLILGAQVKGDPPRPSLVLKERLDTAIHYLASNPQTTVIVSGGQGANEPDSEANVMAEYLIASGIDAQRIIKEGSSTRTEENIAYSKKIKNLDNMVIVTNDFHMYRAKLLAKRLGVKNVTGLTAPSKTSAKSKSYLREVFSLGYALVFDW